MTKKFYEYAAFLKEQKSVLVKVNENTLEDISFEAGTGKLAAIIGAVGSGKSSILNAILGELPITNGKIKLVGKIG